MDRNKLDKLEKLLEERSKKIKSIRHFDEYFDRLVHLQLRKMLSEINERLSEHTNESLRIFSEDPYEEVKTRYFGMIQLIPENNRRNNFYLNNTRHFPSLIFEGDEIKGSVKITTRLKSSDSSTEVAIDSLNDDKIFDMIYQFLDKAYKI